MRLALSFRMRIFLLVLFVAVVPLGLVGFWLNRTALRSGEDLVRSRVEAALEAVNEALAANWVRVRSRAVALPEAAAVRDALADTVVQGIPGGVRSVFDGISDVVFLAEISDQSGVILWTLGDGGSALGRGVPYHTEVWRGLGEERLGSVDMLVDADALLPLRSFPAQAAGMVVGLFDPTNGRSLRAVPFDAQLLLGDRFSWGGEDWAVARHAFTEPRVTLAVAAPVSTFVGPFEEATRRGLVLLVFAGVAAMAAAWALTRRLTQSLEALSGAAEAVSAGHLGSRVTVRDGDEFANVARAFNSMSDSLERTLDELSKKESLAAVGQFAASLAHEIRNPLAAIRIDLQRVVGGFEATHELRRPAERALQEIERLNGTVEGALARARSAAPTAEMVDLMSVLGRAVHAVGPLLLEREATLVERAECDGAAVRGHADALEQVFLNVLKNAAEALGPGGQVELSVRRDGARIVTEVEDNGSGVPDEFRAQVFEALFTTRPEGTGLGLTVARRIVEAHGGAIRLENVEGRGARAVVELPAL